MAEDEAIFDPTVKKKKKKKKTPFDMEAALAGESTPEAPATETTPMESENIPPANTPYSTQTTTVHIREDVYQEEEEKPGDEMSLDLEFRGKKKKKKKKRMDMTGLEEALPEVLKDMDNDMESGNEANNVSSVVENDFGELDLSLKGKKKKKDKRKVVIDDELNENENEKEDNEKDFDVMLGKSTDSSTWAGSERDYTYEELLTRVFEIMRAKNPDMVSGEKKRFVMRPPQVVRVGTKKSSFVNFADICKMLHRQPNHLLAFLLAELGTSGSIDGNNQLIIKGRFQQKQIENVLRHYIKEYVTCHTCRSPDTILQKDNRLFFLQCETCHSRCSVASIKSGFQAVTTKRAQMRAKAT
ncbi:eukaryotic translation initiation factor 2 subunit 2-like [Saccoglossus kowalevskii]|uniref:Eukaryotic translation initiation factor 2 subunit 2 n=1 Tax=Saccoglossus kowalevskii TaxID=10224 RepID=A0ABM0H0Q3_SACKO|nr:PREDICTED: eukaryotic translation initiation factor 2 subunit 2-like [Saccoglossus kowalevskii]